MYLNTGTHRIKPPPLLNRPCFPTGALPQCYGGRVQVHQHQRRRRPDQEDEQGHAETHQGGYVEWAKISEKQI